MSLLLTYVLYFLIGAIEWGLAFLRIEAQIRGMRKVVAIIVVLEVLLGFFIFDKFFVNRNWLIVIIYALGCGTGALFIKRKKDESENNGS